jgi:hypothetical protein
MFSQPLGTGKMHDSHCAMWAWCCHMQNGDHSYLLTADEDMSFS